MTLFGGMLNINENINNLKKNIIMKIHKYILIILLFSIGILSSCSHITDFFDKDEGIVSDTSVSPIFVLDGGEVMTWNLGQAWVEPGYHCSEIEKGADDLTNNVVVDNSSLNVNERGLYSISYTAKNKFGLEKKVYRSVLVTEGVSDLFDISGTYYQGFIPNEFNKMQISPSETQGFWYVTNIYSVSDPVSAYIADLGDKTYVITNSFYRRKVDLRVLMCNGIGEYNESTNKITFTVHLYYEETGLGTGGADKVWTWTKL